MAHQPFSTSGVAQDKSWGPQTDGGKSGWCEVDESHDELCQMCHDSWWTTPWKGPTFSFSNTSRADVKATCLWKVTCFSVILGAKQHTRSYEFPQPEIFTSRSYVMLGPPMFGCLASWELATKISAKISRSGFPFYVQVIMATETFINCTLGLSR